MIKKLTIVYTIKKNVVTVNYIIKCCVIIIIIFEKLLHALFSHHLHNYIDIMPQNRQG